MRQIKFKVREFRRQLVCGELPKTRPQLSLYLGWGASFLLGFLLSGVPIGDAGGPLGIAITAVVGSGVAGLLCGLGASAAYLLFFGFEDGIRFVAAVALTFTAGYVTQELKVYKSRWFLPGLAGLFTLLTGLLSSFSAVNGSLILLPVVLQTFLAIGGAYFFREALSREERNTESAELRHMVALVILVSALLMVLSHAMLFGTVSLGHILAVSLVMIAGYKCGAVTGAAAGLILGASMDLAEVQDACYAIPYALSGLIGGVFYHRGRLCFSACFLLTAVVAVFLLHTGGYRIATLYECGVSALIFLLLPNGWMSLIGAAIKPTAFDGGETGLRRYTAQRIRKMSEAFSDLYTAVESSAGNPVNDEDISRVFDRASESVCVRCKNKNLCWNTNYMDTLSALNDTVEKINSRGLVFPGDLPPHFRDACLQPEALVGAINGELRARMYRRQLRARLEEGRSAAYGQYADLSAVLSGVAEELQNAFGPDLLTQRRLIRFLSGMEIDADVSVFRDRVGRLHIVMESVKLSRLLQEPGYLDKISTAVGVRLCRPGGEQQGEGRIILLEAEPYSVSVGIAALKKTGEAVSGDRGTYFKTEQGVLCILLSDGMGCGESAARESVTAVRILERFLRTGVEPALAMKMLNGLLLLKNQDDVGFATVDLLCIDLFTGEAAFYKYGAAPSYVRSGKKLRRIQSESLAAGLMTGEGAMPDVTRLRLRPGSLAVIASDGVLAETEDGWIRTLLAEAQEPDVKSLARTVLQQALKNYGCSDDMTVLAVRMEARG